jgi:predicted nucleic acid-binding protein
MITYIDANAVVQMYLHLPGEERASRFLATENVNESLQHPMTDLLRCEITNAIERMVFESKQGKTPRISAEVAMMAHADLEADLQSGGRWKRVPLSLSDIELEFDTLSRRYTAMHGFRTYDLIHVASALKLRCRRFLSFDQKANALAQLMGLKTVG